MLCLSGGTIFSFDAPVIWLYVVYCRNLKKIHCTLYQKSCRNKQVSHSPTVLGRDRAFLAWLLDCKTVVFFLKISKEIGKACRKSLTPAKRASLPRSRSLFSASFQTFCLTTRAYLNTQKYRLFCSPHDCELMRVNLLAKTKAYIGKLRLSRWKTIEIMKIIRFQSLKVTSTQGISVSNNQSWEELVVRTEKWKKPRLNRSQKW